MRGIMAHMIAEGEKAPDFSAPDQSGVVRRLSDYVGKWVVLYFYPKDFTFGCTAEACAFRDTYSELKRYAAVLGVSRDTEKSHSKFAEKHSLPFTLLSDPGKKIISAYGAGGAFTRRITYVIAPDQTVAKAYPKVTPATHAREVLDFLKTRTL